MCCANRRLGDTPAAAADVGVVPLNSGLFTGLAAAECEEPPNPEPPPAPVNIPGFLGDCLFTALVGEVGTCPAAPALSPGVELIPTPANRTPGDDEPTPTPAAAAGVPSKECCEESDAPSSVWAAPGLRTLSRRVVRRRIWAVALAASACSRVRCSSSRELCWCRRVLVRRAVAPQAQTTTRLSS